MIAIIEVGSLLLIILSPASWLPEYTRQLLLPSSQGVSLSATAINTCVAQAQIATFYYLYQSANQFEHGAPVDKPFQSQDYLNLLQLLFQWLCCFPLFLLVIIMPSELDDFRRPAGQRRSAPFRDTVTAKMWVSTILLGHILIFFLTRPPSISGNPYSDFFGILEVFRNINAAIVNPVCTLSLIAAFLRQAQVIRQTKVIEAFSQRTLAFQVLLFTGLAISWPFRLTIPASMWDTSESIPLLTTWYPWVGWACVNNAIVAIGQAFVLYHVRVVEREASSSIAENTEEREGERQPLLHA